MLKYSTMRVVLDFMGAKESAERRKMRGPSLFSGIVSYLGRWKNV